MDHRITWNQQQKRQTNSDQSRTKSDDKCLSIKDLRYISFGRTDGTEDTDFFFSLQYTDIRDDTDHDRRNDQWDCHKRNQNVTDDIHNICHGRHQRSNYVRICDDLLFFSVCLHPAVVIIQDLYNLFFTLKIFWININAGWFRKISIAKFL